MKFWMFWRCLLKVANVECEKVKSGVFSERFDGVGEVFDMSFVKLRVSNVPSDLMIVLPCLSEIPVMIIPSPLSLTRIRGSSFS